MRRWPGGSPTVIEATALRTRAGRWIERSSMQKKAVLPSLCLFLAGSGCASDDGAGAPAALEDAPAMTDATPAASDGTSAASEDAPAAPDAAPAAIEDAPAASDMEPTAPDDSIVVNGMFASESERARFTTEVLPSARAFLSYWAEVGVTALHAPPRLVILPPEEVRSAEALPQLYGESIASEMRALEAAVESAASPRAAFDRINAFTCAHPPLDRGFLEEAEEELDPDASLANLAAELRSYHDELLGPDAALSDFFGSENAEFELPLRRDCSYILLGHSSDGTSAHPFLQADVVNHELGHALNFGFWLSSGPLSEQYGFTAIEAIADILAHVFDADACHGKVLDDGGSVVDCRRRMDVYTQSVSDASWAVDGSRYEAGQALRQLIWTLRKEVPLDALRVAIREGMAGVRVAVNQVDEEPLAGVITGDDAILAKRFRFVREYEASAAFFDGVCESLGQAPAVCGERELRIGDPRQAMRQAWLANSPTAIGEQGVTLADGRRVSFVIEGRRIRQMVVTLASGEQQSYSSEDGFDVDETAEQITLWFAAPGEAAPDAQVGWSSDGQLTAR